MRISYNSQNINIYQYDQTTNQNRTGSNLSNTSTSNFSNQAAILELSGNEQMQMEDYQPYSVNSVQTTYAMASTATLNPYELYDSWLTEFGALVDQRLTDSYTAIDLQKGTAEGLTEEFKDQLDNDQITWFQQQYDSLLNQLRTSTSLTEEELNSFMQQPYDLLGKMDLDMYTAINHYMNTGEKANVSFSGALSVYRNFDESLGQEIANYLGPINQEISNRGSTITNDEIEEYFNEFNEWTAGLMNNLISDLEDAEAPYNTKLLLEGYMQNTFEIVLPDIWNSINNTILQKNSEITNANRRRQQAAETDQLNKLKIDYKTGSDTNEISISTSKPSSSKYSTKFVVEGSDGKNKDVYIGFSDERLKKEFDKRIKAAGLEGKKLSIKEFNEIMEELKDSLKDLGEIDLDALFKKMENGEKDLDFEHSMNRFVLYLKRAVRV